jgi:hypothetical protein
VDVILGNVFDVIARLCKGRVLLSTQSELLAVISVAESQSAGQAGLMNLQVARFDMKLRRVSRLPVLC